MSAVAAVGEAQLTFVMMVASESKELKGSAMEGLGIDLICSVIVLEENMSSMVNAMNVGDRHCLD